MNNKFNYLKIYTIIFAILSALYIILSIIIYKDSNIKERVILFCFSLIPFICSLFIFAIGKFTGIKHPRITKFLANIINISILVIHSIFMFIIFWACFVFTDLDDTEYTEIEDYSKALNSYSVEAISHFPIQVPQNAENISLLRTPDSFTGDSEFYLKFDISKDYIEKEKVKYKNQGEIIVLNKDDYFTNNNYNVEQESAIILNSIIDESVKSWTVLFLERNQCFRGIAFKNNTIVYILSCD